MREAKGRSARFPSWCHSPATIGRFGYLRVVLLPVQTLAALGEPDFGGWLNRLAFSQSI
jgi:hypothetical protein